MKAERGTENLDCENSPEDGYDISDPIRRKSYMSTLQSSSWRCWINIPSCTSKKLQPVMSHGSITLLNPTRCLHARVKKRFQGPDRDFDQNSYDYGVFRITVVSCPGCPP
jgi:hypothetical protein